MSAQTSVADPIGRVVDYLNAEASGYGDSISPGFAVRYRGAATALQQRKDPTLANEILGVEENEITAQLDGLRSRLARIKMYRATLACLKA